MQCSGYSFTMYFVTIKAAAYTIMPWMFAAGYFMGNDSNLLIVFYVQIMPDDFVMQLHRF